MSSIRENKILGVIPARFASTRFPGKPLVEIDGKSMIQRVYEQVEKANLIDEVVVATDDDRIYSHIESLNANVCMTADYHQSGTDRCAEVSKQYPNYNYIINIQGDEPFIHPLQIDQLAQTLINSDSEIATLVKKVTDQSTIFDENKVKVVFDKNNKALYFSRNPIPFIRGVEKEDWLKKAHFYKHIGMYGYQKSTLLAISKLPIGTLEKLESLEQLRWLENGYQISIGITQFESIGIDTPEDLKKIM